MKKESIFLLFVKSVFDNDTDAYNPEVWANESLAILEENMVMAHMVHTEFKNEIASFGDVVNTRRPSEFTAKRKGANDDVTIQDVEADNIAIKLNQHWHTSFIIKDEEQSKSFKDLVTEKLSPAMLSIAQAIDIILNGQYVHFLGNSYGTIGGLNNTNVRQHILGIRKIQNDLKVPVPGRIGIIGSTTESIFLDTDQFTNANQVGDDGTALREASIGKKLGYNWFMCQNSPEVDSATVLTVDGEINDASGFAKGVTSITVDGFSAAIAAGTYFTVEGAEIPYTVVSTTGAGTPTEITFTPALSAAVVDNADVKIVSPVLVDLTAGYAAGYYKYIHVDGITSGKEPQVGQIVYDGTNKYTIIEVSGTGTEVDILLDIPLISALTNNDPLYLGPGGNYNFCFRKNAIALITRPLATPREGIGAQSAVVSYEGLSVRVVITYNGTKQGTLVTVDILGGVKVLDSAQGAVLIT